MITCFPRHENDSSKHPTVGVFTTVLHPVGRVRAYIPHRPAFAAQSSGGNQTSRAIFGWLRAVMEAIVKPQRASS